MAPKKHPVRGSREYISPIRAAQERNRQGGDYLRESSGCCLGIRPKSDGGSDKVAQLRAANVPPQMFNFLAVASFSS
jgi:hypothetical protein